MQFYLNRSVSGVPTIVGYPTPASGIVLSRATLLRGARHHQEHQKLDPSLKQLTLLHPRLPRDLHRIIYDYAAFTDWVEILQALPDSIDLADVPDL